MQAPGRSAERKVPPGAVAEQILLHIAIAGDIACNFNLNQRWTPTTCTCGG